MTDPANPEDAFALRPSEETASKRRGRPAKTKAEKAATAPELELSDDDSASYVYRAKRLNNPPAGLAAEGRVAEPPKIAYAYNPHRPPTLRFDGTGAADRAKELVSASTLRALTMEEASELSALLSVQEPWLEWAGKQEKTGFEVDPVALHIHERVSTQAILRSVQRKDTPRGLFADPELDPAKDLQFYQHRMDWANRMVLGDSLQVMASLAKRESLAGQVQMIYLDPPYGIKFASNFQPEVGKRDVKDKDSDMTREPEMVRAYRDTWTLGVHSYLAYLRDRLMLAKELLADSGSIFVQISDENLHRVRMVMDEVFGPENCCALVTFFKTTGQTSTLLPPSTDYLLWYAKKKLQVKYRELYTDKNLESDKAGVYNWLEDSKTGQRQRLTKEEKGSRVSIDGIFRLDTMTSQSGGKTTSFGFSQSGQLCSSGKGFWKTNLSGMNRLGAAERVVPSGTTLAYIRFINDFPAYPFSNLWTDTGTGSFTDEKVYVVQTGTKVIERCMLMTTDPGDLVLDPTCGSGTTAYVAEQWGRRWITCDSSRVALALARQRLMTAKFDYYALRELNDEDRARNHDGTWLKDLGSGEARTLDCRTVPHVTLRSIAQNPDLDPIFAKHEPILDAALAACNAALKAVTPALRDQLRAKLTTKEKAEGKRAVTDADRRRWLLPPEQRDRSADAKKRATVDLEFSGWYAWEVPFDTDADWPKALQEAVTAYRAAWRAKMDEVNACIAANAAQEELVDQPRVVKGITRVSGPFTVESVLPELESLDEDSPIEGTDGELPAFDPQNAEAFQEQVLSWLRVQGVDFLDNKHQHFLRLDPLPGSPFLQAQGEWGDAAAPRKVAVSLGPRIGNVSEYQVGKALRQAYQRGFQELVFAGFGFDATAQGAIQQHAEEGGEVRTHLLLIRPDAAMGDLLKTGPGAQLFTAMGLPRTKLERLKGGEFRVHMEGVDIYNPVDHSLVPTGADKVAAWFLDQDYDGRAFCITQAFFPDKDAWTKLAKAMKAADAEAFRAFAGTTSLPFSAGNHGRCAIKVIDPRGNEVMTTHRLVAE